MLIQKSKLIVTICLLLLGASAAVYGQENEPLSNFKFTVDESSEGVVKLSCQEGCAWETLSFKAEEAQAVNQYGMTSIKEKEVKDDSDLASFLFTIKSTADGVELHGLKGTAWTHLTFGMKGKGFQSLNEMGMTSSE